MAKRLHATVVIAMTEDNGMAMWLFVSHTRIVGVIDIPDRHLSGRVLDPPLFNRDNWITPTTQSFTYNSDYGWQWQSVPRDYAVFANVRMHVEDNGELKLADQTQWEGIMKTWEELPA
jgi:hypothetical protein